MRFAPSGVSSLRNSLFCHRISFIILAMAKPQRTVATDKELSKEDAEMLQAHFEALITTMDRLAVKTVELVPLNESKNGGRLNLIEMDHQ